jgi:hypothetical protein
VAQAADDRSHLAHDRIGDHGRDVSNSSGYDDSISDERSSAASRASAPIASTPSVSRMYARSPSG